MEELALRVLPWHLAVTGRMDRPGEGAVTEPLLLDKARLGLP